MFQTVGSGYSFESQLLTQVSFIDFSDKKQDFHTHIPFLGWGGWGVYARDTFFSIAWRYC